MIPPEAIHAIFSQGGGPGFGFGPPANQKLACSLINPSWLQEDEGEVNRV
jgi:hypothetical protein